MKKTISLRWKLARTLLLFGLFIIAVLFVFQGILLEPMYEANKISTVKTVSDSVAAMIQSGAEVDEETLFAMQLENDTCVRVIDTEDADEYFQPPGMNAGCVLYRMNPQEISNLVTQAYTSEDGTYLSRESTYHGMPDEKEKIRDDKSIRNITYVRMVREKEGDEDSSLYAVMVYTGFPRVNDASRTLNRQLLYIGVITIAAVIFLTWLLDRSIARPLSVINKEAKNLPEGEYTADPSTNCYREAQELNATLVQAADDIKKADKARRDLIANVSHDLRTPLTMITGYGEMMIDMPEEKTDENIQVIIDESRRLSVLVNDLLDLSRMQEGKIRLQCEKFDLHEMISSELRKYDVYTREGYQIEYIPAMKCIVNADRRRMEQVFNNYMTNALHYGGEAKHIIVREVKMENSIQVQVRDFGEGIAEKDLSNIWERYYKVDKEHVRTSSGSGIGLSIVRSILDLHHARYGVNSEPGKGSTFWFELPLCADDEKGNA